MIAWFAKNSVAVTFLMLSILLVGAYVTSELPLEVFPSTEIDQVSVTVVQRASTPEDVEQGITNRIEDAVADLDFIDELSSRSTETMSQVTIKMLAGTDHQKALNEVKSKVDALSTLPQTAERPVIEVPSFSALVLKVIVSGDISEKELVSVTRRLRDDLKRVDGITVAELEGVRPFEVGIEVSQDVLRAYSLTLDDIAAAIRSQSRDISGGQLRTVGGDILVRTKSQAYDYADFHNIVLKRFSDGSELRLSEIAHIDDGFDENPIVTKFNGKPSATINIFRVGKESAISVSERVAEYIRDKKYLYPDTIEIELWNDNSDIVKDRLSILLTSAWQGALLIIIMLTLFLHPTVAIWVVVGIPVCFAGALALFPLIGLTINSVSLFAFILVLGVVVDDAIVTGENIYTHRKRGSSALQAAIAGTEEVSKPVIFGIVTTMLAFVPLLLLPSNTRTFGLNMGAVVIPVLLFSLIESKFILPNHLSHLQLREGSQTGLMKWLMAAQAKVSGGLDVFVERIYQPLLVNAVNARYFTVVTFFCVLIFSGALIQNGWIKSSFMPEIASESATATVTFPTGTPFAKTSAAVARMEQAVFEMGQKYRTDDGSVFKGVFTVAGASIATRARGVGGAGTPNIGSVEWGIDRDRMSELDLDIETLVNEWRERVGIIEGAEKVIFTSELFSGGAPIFLRLEGHNVEDLHSVSALIRDRLSEYQGVFDIEDSLQDGKRELQIDLSPQAQLLGLSIESVTTQVRHALFGSEAQRIQRGVDDVRVMVRYPLDERRSLAQLDNLLITTPGGGEARFGDVADVRWTRSPSNIYHVNQLRTATVKADINRAVVDAAALNAELANYVREILRDYPDVSFNFDGEEKDRTEFVASFQAGLFGILLAIFALLAIAFRSYLQPIILMSVIPFAMTGAVLGHGITGIYWSVFSFFGILALVGVVINDALVLVDWINRRLAEAKMTTLEIVLAAGKARFRAVMLTSLTTFAGLVPILSHQSVGASFLKPMAVSLGFGIVYATAITLLLVPCNFMILEDVRALKRRLLGQQVAPTLGLDSRRDGL